MTRARAARILIIVCLLVAALVWVFKTSIEPEKVTLAIAAVVGAVTAVHGSPPACSRLLCCSMLGM